MQRNPTPLSKHARGFDIRPLFGQIVGRISLLRSTLRAQHVVRAGSFREGCAEGGQPCGWGWCGFQVGLLQSETAVVN